MSPFSIYVGSYMVTPRANLANLASCHCVNHVSEWGGGSFSQCIVPPYKSALCDTGD